MKKNHLLVTLFLCAITTIQAQVRWVDSVVAFSSELIPSPGPSSAAKLIGADPYPVCGDDTSAWASASPDGMPEFLVVHFSGAPAPVNDISIYQNYNPGAIDSVSLFNPNTSAWEVVYTTDTSRYVPTGTCNILRIEIPLTTYNVSLMRITINSQLIGGYNEISAIDVQNLQSTTRWVDSVYSVSSEYSSGNDPWSSSQVVGLPNTYPLYGDLGTAWETENTDDPEESIVLHFGGRPKPIQGINVYETFNPGAVDSVFALDAGGDWQLLWSGTAQIAPDTSRIFHITFPRTSYNVSFIRLMLNSGAVPGYNEIDAVSLVDTFTVSGIVPVTANINFLLYPNPAAQQLILQVPDAGIHKEASLLTTQGQQLSRWEIETPVTNLPIGNLPAGIYLVKIENTVQRFIKQ